MSEYFLKLPGDSRPKAYSEYEVREMLGQGIINSQILTWKQGMEGWQPLDQVLPDLKMPPLPQQQFTAATKHPETQPYTLRYPVAGIAKLAIPACLILLPFMLWCGWVILSENPADYEEIQQLIQQSINTLPPFAAQLISIFSLLFIPSLLIQLIWLYRASANVRGFQAQGLRYTPFLSVLLSCMPVVGMILNALILQELYKASKNPENWIQQPASKALKLYLLVNTAMTLCAMFPLGTGLFMTIFLLILMAIASILWLVCILQITKCQITLISDQQNTRR